MRKKRIIRLAAVLLLCAGALAWAFSSPREPMYQGRPLSFWLQGYVAGARTETSQVTADAAMNAVGTNAIPTLLRMQAAHDSPRKLKFISLLQKQHVFKIDPVPATRLNYEAVGGFNQLGPQAKSAVPALIAIYERNISEESQDVTADSLAAIGPAAKSAVPALLKTLSNTNLSGALRVDVLNALGEIHSEPDLVVPELIKALKLPDPVTRDVALNTLGEFGADARSAVPALMELIRLKDPSQNMKDAAFHALQRIDPQVAAKIEPEISKGL